MKNKILIVDDSAIARMGVKKMLVDRDYIIEESISEIKLSTKSKVSVSY